MDTWYICVYPHYWGRGHSPKQAKKEARKAGGMGRNWVIKELPSGAVKPWLSGTGYLCWDWHPNATETQREALEGTFVVSGNEYKG